MSETEPETPETTLTPDLRWARDLVTDHLALHDEATKGELQGQLGIGPGDLRTTLDELLEEGAIVVSDEGVLRLAEASISVGQGRDADDEDEEPDGPAISLGEPEPPQEYGPEPEPGYEEAEEPLPFAGYGLGYECVVSVTLAFGVGTNDAAALAEAQEIRRQIAAAMPGEAKVDLTTVRTRPRTLLG